MDEADYAQEKADFLASLPRVSTSPLPPTGFCYNCDEPLVDGRKFCDNDCRDDWELRNDVSRSGL